MLFGVAVPFGGGPVSSGREHVLVGTDWVALHLADPDVRLVEVDEDPLLYEFGHIPGAAVLHRDRDPSGGRDPGALLTGPAAV